MGVLRWMCMGAALQVITWPLGFIILAKGKQVIYFLTQLAWTIVSLGLAYLCVRWWGLIGAGVAFFGSYIFFGIMDYLVAIKLCGFCWSRANLATGAVHFSLIAIAFSGFYLLPFVWAACLGALALILSTVHSIWTLSTLISWDHLPPLVQRLIGPFRPFFSKNTGPL